MLPMTMGWSGATSAARALVVVLLPLVPVTSVTWCVAPWVPSHRSTGVVIVAGSRSASSSGR